MAIGLYRPEVYDIIQDEDDNSTDVIAEIICVKSHFEDANKIYRISQNANFKVVMIMSDALN